MIFLIENCCFCSGVQCSAAAGILPGLLAAEHGGLINVRRLRPAFNFRQEAAQSRRVGRSFADAASAHQEPLPAQEQIIVPPFNYSLNAGIILFGIICSVRGCVFECLVSLSYISSLFGEDL